MSSTWKQIKRLKRAKFQAHMGAKAANETIRLLVLGLTVYADPKNWRDTDETKDVKHEGIIVGLDVIKMWVGPKSGPELAQVVLGQVVVERAEDHKG